MFNRISQPPQARLPARAPENPPAPNQPGRANPNIHPATLPGKPPQARVHAPGMDLSAPGAMIPPDRRPATPPIDGSNLPGKLPFTTFEEVPGKPGFHTTRMSAPGQGVPVWTGYHHADPVQWETLKQTDAAHSRFVGENRYGYVDHSHVQTHDTVTGKVLPQPKTGLGPSETGNVYRNYRPEQALTASNPLDPLYSGAGKTHPRTGEPLGPGKNDGLRGQMRLNMDASHIASTGHVHPTGPKGYPYLPSRADMQIMAGNHPVNSEGRPIDHIIAAPRPPRTDAAPGAATHGDMPVGIIYNSQSYKTLLPPHPGAPERPDFTRFTHPLGTDHPPGPPGPRNFSGNATGHTYPPGKDYPTDLQF